MRKWLNKSIALYDRNPATTEYQRGFRDALIRARNEVARRSDNRKILVAKLAVVAVLAGILIGVSWRLLAP